MVPNEPVVLSTCTSHLAATGRRKDASALLERLTTFSKKTPVENYQLAYAYAGLGEKARALDLLERTVEERSPNAVMMNTDFARTLGSEPRYQALLRKMKVPVPAGQ